MATVKLYLDKRGCAENTPAPVKISICMNGRTALQSTGVKVLPEQWDEVAARVTRHPKHKYLNAILTSKLNDWQLAILKLSEEKYPEKLSSVTELKRTVLEMLHPELCKPKSGTFIKQFERFAESRRTPGSRSTYRQTLRRIRAFDMEIEQRTFDEIDKQWLTDFEAFMAQTAKSANARALHFRNIRAVFNDAIDNDLTQSYPFRKFKIRREPTRKRSLSVEQLRLLICYPCEPYQVQYRDIFVLMFYLIGINAVDLFHAKQDVALGHGGITVTDIYIDFDRRKVDNANRCVIDWMLYGKRNNL